MSLRTLRPESTLAAAERVVDILSKRDVECVVIGAIAMAVHQYPRSTEDLDLATHVDPFTTLRRVVDDLKRAGFEAELNDPDADDPLGGVVTIAGGDFDQIQIVNFLNPFGGGRPDLAAEAIRDSVPIADCSLRAADLPHLIALKLYAGGAKSKADVIELIARNQPLNWDQVQQVCDRFAIGDDWRALLAELKSP